MNTRQDCTNLSSTLTGGQRLGQNRRISHRKSRNGCYNCKQRRVKCDEKRPKCGTCAARNDDCIFPTPHRPRNRSKRLSGSRQPERSVESSHDTVQMDGLCGSLDPLSFNWESNTPSSQHDYAPPDALNMHDLSLLQHYILHTAKRMSLHPGKIIVWERVIPDMAASNKFLMHLVLALGGLDMLTSHNLHERNFEKCLASAPTSNSSSTQMSPALSKPELIIEHHQQGLKGLREKLGSNDSNAEVLVAGAMLIVAFSFASLRMKDSNPFFSSNHTSSSTENKSSDAREAVEILQMQWLFLVRGLTAMMEQNWLELRRSRVRSLCTYENANDDWKKFEFELRSAPLLPGKMHSRRISNFSSGASQALLDLQTLCATLRDGIHLDPAPNKYESTMGLLESCDEAMRIVDLMYMRVLHVLSMAEIEPLSTSSLEIQAAIEDAGIAAWPHLLPESFASSLHIQGDLELPHGLCLVIIAHLYASIAILEDIWIFGRSCDNEICKINALVGKMGHAELTASLAWPMRVIED